MKQMLSMMTALFLILNLTACSHPDANGISFYYSRDPEQYQYFESDSVIRSETRDLLNHRQDLPYMVGLYLAGPMEEGLISPFPKTVRLLSVENKNGSIIIELTDHSLAMTDAEFALACACLTLTCLDFTDCQYVTVISGQRSLTMNRDSILLSDILPQQETTGG